MGGGRKAGRDKGVTHLASGQVANCLATEQVLLLLLLLGMNVRATL